MKRPKVSEADHEVKAPVVEANVCQKCKEPFMSDMEYTSFSRLSFFTKYSSLEHDAYDLRVPAGIN